MLPSLHTATLACAAAHSMGPLLWSIVAFRNSLVYHSLDKMTRCGTVAWGGGA